MCRLLFLLPCTLLEASARPTPTDFVYSKDVADSHERVGSCTLWSWEGQDSYGMTGPPWVSLVQCDEGAQHRVSGIAAGDFQVWLLDGWMASQEKQVRHLGESFWIAGGAAANLTVAGSAYIVGAPFHALQSREATFTSSWLGPKSRSFELQDAVAGLGGAFLAQDEHICNGSSPSMDFVFRSRSGVDPASVVVLNCASGSSPDTNFVWSHFHPFGAVYMPLSGRICFASDKVACVEPGTARWVSPNLQYYEYFQKINASNVQANQVRDLAGVSTQNCEYPNVFAVTNFDAASGAGVPNFADWPEKAHGSTSAVGIGPWGVFPKMAVQATRVVVGVVEVQADGDAVAV